MKELKQLGVAATAIVGLATISIMGIAVLTGFKNTGLVNNATADTFIAGIAVFGTFVGIIALALVGKIVISMFKSDKEY